MMRSVHKTLIVETSLKFIEMTCKSLILYILLLFPFTGWCFSNQSRLDSPYENKQKIALDYDFLFPDRNTPQRFQITAEGSYLINDYQNIIDFYQDGTVKTIIPIKQNFFATSFAYLPIQGWYVVCAIDLVARQKYIENYENGIASGGIPPIYETLVFNENGALLGYGHDKAAPKKPLFFYQLLVVEDRIFINSMNLLMSHPLDRGLLQEVQIEQDADRFLFKVSGDPFSFQERESAMKEDYRFRWILTEDVTHEMDIIDELQPRTQVFSSAGNGRYEKKLNLSKPINLPNRRAPFGSTRDFSLKKGSSEDPNSELYDHSRVVGAYSLENGALIGYIRPNPKYKAFSDLEIGVEPEDGAEPFILCLQRVDQNYKNLSDPLEREGCYLLGVYRNKVFIYHPADKAVEVLRIIDFN